MRVFILSTGRSASLAFAGACKKISNYTPGHETRASILGKDRFIYPDQHRGAEFPVFWKQIEAEGTWTGPWRSL